MVRLFLCFFIALTPLQGEEPSIPIKWKREAIARNNAGSAASLIPAYEKSLVRIIRERILATKERERTSYLSKIPETGVPYEMIYLKGGSFLMGSPPDEPSRNLDESPQRQISISSFWMGKYETTWAQFTPYAQRTPPNRYTKTGSPRDPEGLKKLTDWITAPSQVYTDPDFGMGMDDQFPAVGMTQNSANRFCQWLSLQTGHFYRLPTEAEWEYACRAGTTSPYHCPGDKLEEYAVIDPDQTREAYAKVGTKKPNPWGLFDIHGNVSEWCIDAYRPGYEHLDSEDPWEPPTQRYGRVIRGGSWYDTAEYCRSARRFCSHPDLNLQDPQTPQSIWWLVDSQWLGFRIVRPVEIPSEEEMYQIWNSGAMHHRKDDRIFELY